MKKLLRYIKTLIFTLFIGVVALFIVPYSFIFYHSEWGYKTIVNDTNETITGRLYFYSREELKVTSKCPTDIANCNFSISPGENLEFTTLETFLSHVILDNQKHVAYCPSKFVRQQQKSKIETLDIFKKSTYVSIQTWSQFKTVEIDSNDDPESIREKCY